ncbi:cytosine deaminase [Romeria aff. gracilis LEGE 07310]|uniref:Cytosine deaminase n=1 Tax=Vasconcelosia minhoensis LEGE 07310 TaxID=915328 RepID=A0A8J7AW06_9CYAN|nr:cytosine deaminase [Romeria gracilis]MBE9080109.1 cytosine deaminase [Romeria aff. gracilis LEGE 07310]
MNSFIQLPARPNYWLCNARIPLALLADDAPTRSPISRFQTGHYCEDLVAVDVQIEAGQIRQLRPASAARPAENSQVDLGGGLIWPCFVDMHTHLDKGHIWSRTPNPNGTFDSALETVQKDREQRWQAADVYRRMVFGLKCSYAHGTQAIRTHIDAFDEQAKVSFSVFQNLQREWADRIHLQAVCLVSLDYFMTQAGEQLADLVAETGGVLGGVAYMTPDLAQQLDRVFSLAEDRGLDLDFHTDESLNPEDITLRYVAEAAIRHNFSGQITCGHCCSLSVQSPQAVDKTISAVQAANISIVSLPMCNLYLQDRQPSRMPRYRGVTLLPELKSRGVKVAIASDNCRDPFFAYGDHDALEVFTQSARIGHLDHPYGDWPQAITRTPAAMMGLPDVGYIGEGQPAELVLFKARTLNELLARPQTDRVVIRQGRAIDTTLPDYAELDDLMEPESR